MVLRSPPCKAVRPGGLGVKLGNCSSTMRLLPIQHWPSPTPPSSEGTAGLTSAAACGPVAGREASALGPLDSVPWASRPPKFTGSRGQGTCTPSGAEEGVSAPGGEAVSPGTLSPPLSDWSWSGLLGKWLLRSLFAGERIQTHSLMEPGFPQRDLCSPFCHFTCLR